MLKQSTLSALQSKGITAESDVKEIKKSYFGITSTPLTSDKLAEVQKALAGDTSVVDATEEAPAAEAPSKAKRASKPKAEKAPAAPKEPKPAKAQAEPVTLEALKADPRTAQRWHRVTEILERGTRGNPTRVRILCDDKGEGGTDLFRDIAVQDLFQVRYSAGHAKKQARRKSKPVAAGSES